MSRLFAWILLGAVIVFGAITQTMTSVAGSAPADTTARVLLALLSALLLFGEVVIATVATTTITTPEVSPSWQPVAAWAGILLVLLVAAALVWPPLPILVAVAACVVLPAAASGRYDAWRGFAVFRTTPGRAAAAMASTLVAVVIGAVIALLTGFFLTPLMGAVVFWLFAGAAGAALLLWWTRLWSRSASVSAPSPIL
ncbi:hypothetical protein [Microbacterium sp. RU33B]|uniref:hypothetical protein n=1 Tax=Microbacterium sp. RU33B TaxID=1907390 RepID=UPI000961D05F|nr:hypothetical protein [Microbacterium sp. RU33B]SIT75574.1 hypothetical protein SAMN05880545_1481 [Microbacterium sp. RU33B]